MITNIIITIVVIIIIVIIIRNVRLHYDHCDPITIIIVNNIIIIIIVIICVVTTIIIIMIIIIIIVIIILTLIIIAIITITIIIIPLSSRQNFEREGFCNFERESEISSAGRLQFRARNVGNSCEGALLQDASSFWGPRRKSQHTFARCILISDVSLRRKFPENG